MSLALLVDQLVKFGIHWKAAKLIQGLFGTYPTNYANFDSTGHLTFTGTAKPWDDLRIEPIIRETDNPTNNPVFEPWYTDGAGSRGIWLYSFDDALLGAQKEIHFTMQMPHSWDSGPIYIHVHWVGAVDDTAAAPRWGLEYKFKGLGKGYTNPTAILYTDGNNYINTGATANVSANIHTISKFAAITPSAENDGLSSILIGRLWRDSGVAGDTYNAAGAKCGLLYIDAHYQIARIGSTDEYVA